MARNVETASRSERVQCTAWAHLARGRGNPHPMKDEIIKVNRGRLRRCVTDQITQFADRKKPRGSLAGRPSYGRNVERITRADGVSAAPSELRSVERITAGSHRMFTGTNALRKRALRSQKLKSENESSDVRGISYLFGPRRPRRRRRC